MLSGIDLLYCQSDAEFLEKILRNSIDELTGTIVPTGRTRCNFASHQRSSLLGSTSKDQTSPSGAAISSIGQTLNVFTP
jgi:hypothetical protein